MADASTPSTAVRALDPTEDIYRRIHPDWIVADETAPGGRRLSSAAFRPGASPCSGYIARECEIADVLAQHHGDSVGAILVGTLEGHGVSVVRDVIPGEHPSHVHLVQPTGLSKKARHNLWSELSRQTRPVAGEMWGL